MQAEAALGRVGLWLLIMVLSIVMVATAADSGMAAHATIIGVIAFVLVWVTAAVTCAHRDRKSTSNRAYLCS